MVDIRAEQRVLQALAVREGPAPPGTCPPTDFSAASAMFFPLGRYCSKSNAYRGSAHRSAAGSDPPARAAGRWLNFASLRAPISRTASSLASASLSAAPASSENGRGCRIVKCARRRAKRRRESDASHGEPSDLASPNQQSTCQGNATTMERAWRANRAKRRSRAHQFQRKKRSKIHQSGKALAAAEPSTRIRMRRRAMASLNPNSLAVSVEMAMRSQAKGFSANAREFFRKAKPASTAENGKTTHKTV